MLPISSSATTLCSAKANRNCSLPRTNRMPAGFGDSPIPHPTLKMPSTAT